LNGGQSLCRLGSGVAVLGATAGGVKGGLMLDSFK
jgi:hypothetical protein